MRTPVAALLLLAVSGGQAAAQAYRPDPYDRMRGTELVAIYLSATTCGPCRAPWMPVTLDSIKVQLQRQAVAAGRHFRAVMVSMDWSPDSGFALARESGRWDEIVAGRNWANAGAQLYLWADTATTPAMPQIIVFEQELMPGARLEFGPRRVLRRVSGADALRRWVELGAPVGP